MPFYYFTIRETTATQQMGTSVTFILISRTTEEAELQLGFGVNPELESQEREDLNVDAVQGRYPDASIFAKTSALQRGYSTCTRSAKMASSRVCSRINAYRFASVTPCFCWRGWLVFSSEGCLTSQLIENKRNYLLLTSPFSLEPQERKANTVGPKVNCPYSTLPSAVENSLWEELSKDSAKGKGVSKVSAWSKGVLRVPWVTDEVAVLSVC